MSNFVLFSFFRPFLLSVLAFIAVVCGMVFLLRRFFCWYFRIDELKKLDERILDNINEMNALLKNNEFLSHQKLNDFNVFSVKGDNTIKEFENEDEMIIHIFNKYKNIAVYNITTNDESIFTYFQAKQYNIIPINHKNIRFADTKTYATLMSVEQKIEILVIRQGTKNMQNVLNECIARKKIKQDIEYVWFEDVVLDAEIFRKFRDVNIKVISGSSIYKKYVKLMLKTTMCNG